MINKFYFIITKINYLHKFISLFITWYRCVLHLFSRKFGFYFLGKQYKSETILSTTCNA